MASRRIYRLLMTGLGLVVSHSAFSIGIGEISVNSYVNEPFRAQIEVLDPETLSESEIIASLATLSDFDRLGIERHYSLGALVFETRVSSPESAAILVSTEDPVREPYLNFLVELRWPEGRVLREYTVFLDLRPRQVRQSSDRRTASAFATGSDEGVASGEYRVAPNDTLGGIASRFLVDGVSIDQMMLAIKDANPGKFLRDNINGIRAGVLLNIPSTVDTTLSSREAAARVVDEWAAWKQPQAARGLRIVADNELELFGDSAIEVAAVEDLQGVASEPSGALIDDGEDADAARLDAADEANAAVNSDLAVIESRLATLSEQLTAIQEVVASKDQEIAALKAELANRPVANAVKPESVAQPTVEDSTSAPASERGGFGVLWAALVLALLAVTYFIYRRSKGDEGSAPGPFGAEQPDEFDDSMGDLVPVPTERAPANSVSEAEASKGYGESLLTGYAADQSLADAIAEADIYVAYGRHQHALDTLEAASAAEPSNASGLLKMLDIYIGLDRIEEAQALMASIEKSGDQEAVSSAASKLLQINDVLDGDAAAKNLAAQANTLELDTLQELDISLDLEFQEAENSTTAAPEEGDASGMLDTEEDPAETALDLARAYIDMGDKSGAKELLQTAITMGDDGQVEIAKQLLSSIE